MGSEFVQDPFWGNWATNLAKSIQAGPGTALNNAQTVEQIHALREKRHRETEQWNAGVGAANAYPATVPEATVPPSFRDVTVENQGPVNPADPTTQPGEIWLPPTTARESFIDPRLLATAEANRKLAIRGGQATILKDPSQWAAQQAYGQVSVGGAPMDPRERARLQFQTTGRFPTSDETKIPNAQNFTVYENGQPTGQTFASLTGGRTKLDGTPVRLGPGQELLESGPGTPGKPNPIENQQIAQNNFNQLAEKIEAKLARGEGLSNEELNAARAMRDVGWAKKVKFDTNPETGQRTVTPHYDIVPPEAGPAARLFDLLDTVDNVPQSRRVAPPAVTADPVAGTPVVPVTPDAAAAPAPAPRSLVGPTVSTGVGDPRPVVQDYKTQPVIVSIENAKNGYSSLLGNVSNFDQAADLAMIVGAAKVLDPPSVVREGEVENVRRTGGLMDKWMGAIEAARGNAALTKQVRAQLWQAVNDKLTLDVKNASAIREQHAVQLRQRGIDPEKYLPPLPVIVPVDPSLINTRKINVKGEMGPAPAETTAPAGTTTAPTQQQRDQLRLELGR